MKKLRLNIVFVLLLLTSCSQTLQYNTSGNFNLKGNYLLKKLSYNSSKNGVSSKNEIKVKNKESNKNIIIEKDINIYFSESLAQELESCGLELDWGSTKIITGDIETLLIDISNEKVKVIIEVRYTLSKDGKTIDNYSKKFNKVISSGVTVGGHDYNSILEECAKLSINDYTKHLNRKNFFK